MATTTATATLKPGTRVHLVSDIPGLAAGATGKVVLVEGLTWLRYWVAFDSGVRIGSLNRKKLATDDEWERRQSGADAAVSAAVGGAAAPAGAAPAAGGGDKTGGVPDHLLERAKKARERAAAKKAAG